MANTLGGISSRELAKELAPGVLVTGLIQAMAYAVKWSCENGKNKELEKMVQEVNEKHNHEPLIDWRPVAPGKNEGISDRNQELGKVLESFTKLYPEACAGEIPIGGFGFDSPMV